MKTILFALLPLVAITQNFRELFLLAAALVLVFWIGSLFFKGLGRFLPNSFLKPGFFLWGAICAGAGMAVGLAPYWLPSFYLLWPENSEETFFVFLERGLLFWLAAGLTGLLFGLCFPAGEIQPENSWILFAGVFGFLLFMLEKKEAVFLTAVSLIFFVGRMEGEAPRVLEAARLAAVTAFFYFLMIGLSRRLVLSPVPARFAGWPILLLSAALVGLALSGWAR